LRKFKLWAGNGSCVEEIWKSYKDIIFEVIKRYVPQQILSKNPDPECYNKEVKRIEVKVRKMYNKREFGQPYKAELKGLSKDLLMQRRRLRKYFYIRFYKKKIDAWQSSISMLYDVKEIEKIFRRSRHVMASSLQIQYKRGIY